MMKINIITFLIFWIPFFCSSQSIWRSSKYKYSIEIPQGFSITPAIGANVDFKAIKDLSSIVIVIKSIPQELSALTIWDMYGDLETFGDEWELGAKEYFDNPKFLKYGKTFLSNLDAFWFDYTTDNPKLYSKNYQVKKGNKLYTLTLTCPFNEYNFYSSIWFRFKEKMVIE
jgi:hypothetical protein